MDARLKGLPNHETWWLGRVCRLMAGQLTVFSGEGEFIMALRPMSATGLWTYGCVTQFGVAGAKTARHHDEYACTKEC